MRTVAIAVIAVWTLHGQSLPVTSDRLLNADKEPGNWLMYSHTYSGWRYSALDQITTQNVKNLSVKWLFQGRSQDKFETTPLVVDGIMYLTRPENDVFALDAETGRDRVRAVDDELIRLRRPGDGEVARGEEKLLNLL